MKRLLNEPKNSSRKGPLVTIEKLTDAWIRKDREGMAQHLADDIIELGPTFPNPLIGKKEFFQKYRAYLSGPLRIESYRLLSPRLIWLSPWLVLVHFRYKMRTSNQSRTDKSSGQESMLVELKRGQWRVKFVHWHRV
jgi:Domain of unknown function (DUF4440)